MLIQHDPDDYIVEVTQHRCEHHKRQPWDVAWPGCTCSSGVTQRRATPEERAANIKAREEERRRRDQHIRDYDAGKIK